MFHRCRIFKTLSIVFLKIRKSHTGMAVLNEYRNACYKFTDVALPWKNHQVTADYKTPIYHLVGGACLLAYKQEEI